MKWISILLSLGLACETRAMIQVRDLIEPTVRFYRTPSSLFPSGEAALSLLKEKQISSRIDTWYFVENEVSKDWIQSPNLYFSRDFLQQSSESQTAILTSDTNVLRLKKGWRKSETLKSGSTLTITSVRSDWSCGTDLIGPICVPTNKIILAIDSASKVQNSHGKWFLVKFRQGHQMITDSDQVIPVSKIKAWHFNPNIAFIRKSLDPTEKISPTISSFANFERVKILKKELRRWQQSLLLDHGNVWWQNNAESSLSHPQIVLSRAEIMGRPIYDKVIRSKFSLISAQGIFYSKDGETWIFLKQFGEINHPVSIGPRETLIVGDQLSFDEGKTFQSYLRWDQIAMQTQHILNHSPQYLRLQKIRPTGPSSLLIDIDIGYKVLVFEFNTINSQIQFKKSQLNRDIYGTKYN